MMVFSFSAVLKAEKWRNTINTLGWAEMPEVEYRLSFA
jgi:hypothetical protein